MDPLEFLHMVWGAQVERNDEYHSYGFLCLREGTHAWRDLAYRFPDDDLEIPDPALGDVYFTPNMFKRGRRRKELMLPSRWLYADLDLVNPYDIDEKLKPTVAWESSPGRYQGLWQMSRYLPPDEHSHLNKLLTYKLDADKSGWDATQVLRLPGTINHKYDGQPQVTLLWAQS